MSNSDATKPTPRTDAAPSFYCESDESCSNELVDKDFARELERELTEAREAIADLNRRLIDRTSGFLDLIQAQQLEIALLKSQARTAREIIEQAYVHNQNMHCFTTKGRLNDQINEQTTLLRKFLKP